MQQLSEIYNLDRMPAPEAQLFTSVFIIHRPYFQHPEIEPVPLVPPVSEKSSKPSSSPWFTFDDIPLHKWQAQHQEFSTWIDVQMTSPNAQSYNVLREFCSRFIGSL